MITALTVSTKDLSLRFFFFAPDSLMACVAIIEVNLSSILSIGISGNSAFSLRIKGSMYLADSEAVLFICFGSPITKHSTAFREVYSFRKVMVSFVGTVASVVAMIFNSSVTASPTLFCPKSIDSILPIFSKIGTKVREIRNEK
jgi:hypothetical protein